MRQKSEHPESPSERLVKNIRRATRKRHSSEEKTLIPGTQATVLFMLTDDTAKHVRIQVLDANTDNVLYLSPKDIPVKLGV